MAVAFRAAGTLTDTTGTSFTVGKPAGLTSGDFVIVCIHQLTTTQVIISPPDNTWYRAPLQDNTSSTTRATVFYHVATGSEPTWLFEISSSIRSVAVAVAYSGVSSIDICTWATGTATPALAVSATPPTTGDVALCFVGEYSSGGTAAVTLDAALTSRFNVHTTDTEFVWAMGDATVVGSSGAYSNTLVGSSAWAVPVFLLNPTGTVGKSAANVGIVPTATIAASSFNVTSITVNTPTAIQNGDILVGFLRNAYFATGTGTPAVITPPAGFTKVREDIVQPSGAEHPVQLGMYTHTITTVGSEPSSYTWNTSTTQFKLTASITVVRGCTAVDTTTLASATTAVSMLTTTALTPANDNEPLLIFGAFASDAGAPAPTIASLQTETGIAAVTLCSGITPKAGIPTNTYVLNIGTGGISDCAGAYQAAFVPVVTNEVKITGISVVNTYSSVSSQAITVPSTALVSDLAIAHVIGPTGGTITPPSGWTAITNASADDTNFLAQAFSHVIAGGDPGSSVTFTFSGSTNGAASILTFENASNGLITAANSTTHGQTPPLGKLQANSLVLMYEVVSTNPSGTACAVAPQNDTFLTPFVYNPSSANTGNIGVNAALSVLLQTGASGGQIGTQYRTATGSTTGPSMTIAIVAQTPAPPPPTPTPLPPPPGPGPNLPFVYKGRIAALTNIPPVNNWHDLNKLLQKKFVNELPPLMNQIVKYAANPQQHYKVVAQALPTVEQTDVQTSEETSGAPAPVVSSDLANTFSGTGYITTQGPLISDGGLSIPSATPTALDNASPNTPFNSGDTAYLQVNGTFASGMSRVLIDLTVVGNPSSQTYAGFTTTTDTSGNFAVTQQFNVQPATPISNDTSVTVSITQATGSTVTLTVYNVSVGNLQQR